MKKLHEYIETELDELDVLVLWDLCLQDDRDKVFDQIEVDPSLDIDTIFDTLDSYLKFCVKFGRHYIVAHVYYELSLFWIEYLLVVDKDNKTRIQNFWRRDET